MLKTWQPEKDGPNIGQHGQLRNHWMKKREKERRGNPTQRRKLKQQLKMIRTDIRTMYSQKKAAVRIHYMNLYERSSRELTRKETTEEKTEKKKKKKRSLIHVFSFSTVFVAIIRNCFIIF